MIKKAVNALVSDRRKAAAALVSAGLVTIGVSAVTPDWEKRASWHTPWPWLIAVLMVVFLVLAVLAHIADNRYRQSRKARS